MIFLILGWIAILLIILFNINLQGNLIWVIPISFFVFQLGLLYGDEID